MESEDRKKENSYKSILKGVSIFGGVQVFQIAVNLVRGKFVAMFLGPDGMGVSSLFTTSSNTLQRFASLGLNLAIVKEVSESRDDGNALAKTRQVALSLVTVTATAGALFCFLFAGWLSRLTFGSPDFSWQFMLLSAAVWLSISGAGKLSVLQGLHEVKRLSKASITGAVTGLVAGVPLYYFFGQKGIVPAMVLLAAAMWAFYTWHLRKCLPSSGCSTARIWREPLARKLITLGMVLMASDLIGSFCTYMLNIFIRSAGGIDDVGLYQAANSLTNQYTGMVFAAMSLDYFPRLSGCISDNREMTKVVNRQSEIIALILTPIIIALIATTPIVIDILLTDRFKGIAPLMRWMGIGVLVKGFMFPTGYIAFAKNNKRLFFWLEGVTGNLLTLVLGCLGYHLFGLMGLGYALVADTVICLSAYLIINGHLYGYRMTGTVASRYIFGATMAAAAFIATGIPDMVWRIYALASILIAATAVSAFNLRKLFRHKDA